MRIVIITEWFSEGMGYIENRLPKAFAELGHEVHVLSSNAQIYCFDPFYAKTYEPFLGPPFVECGTKRIEGYSLHRLPMIKKGNQIAIRGMIAKLKELKPDIVQTFDVLNPTTIDAALGKLVCGYKLFTGNHIVASVFPMALQKKDRLSRRFRYYIRNTLKGKWVSLVTSLCYPATVDAKDIAVRFLGVPEKKAKICFLGVDTDLFFPAVKETHLKERESLRKKFGFSPSDIVCIYTGRYTEGKNPLCLAKAVEGLAKRGEPYKAIFFGEGPQEEEIKDCGNCIVMQFAKFEDLPQYYRMADIGVWPRQESTSVLDATACGLPVVISDQVQATERKEGNGMTYVENNVEDMMKTLLDLKDAGKRQRLGKAGVEKILTRLSWPAIARQRMADYEVALAG